MRTACLILALCGCNVTVTTDSCSDGILNGSESDTDCGGSCGRCGLGRRCVLDSDCTSDICGTGSVCASPVVTGLPSSAGADTYSIDPGGSVVVQPGTQAGFGITANVGGSYRIFWTGDSGTSGTYREFTGTVWTTGQFDSFNPGCGGVCPLENGDVVSDPQTVSGGQRIDFDTIATDGLDGFDFTVTVEPVYFDLTIDGQRFPDLIFFPSGGVQSNAGTDPFGLTTQ